MSVTRPNTPSDGAATATTTIMTKLANAEPSFLEQHIRLFADENGTVSFDSMKQEMINMHQPPQQAHSTASSVGFFAGLAIKHCPWAKFQAKEGVGTLNHARDTLIYNSDGSINEERWQYLIKNYSEIDQNKAIITVKKFNEFRKWSQDNDTRWDATTIGRRASDGEWHDFFQASTDHWKQSNDAYEPAVTVETLRLFYERPQAWKEKVVSKEIPIAQPATEEKTTLRPQ